MTTSRHSTDSHAIRYRADIDGLRGIAVVSVVVYHLSAAALPGGFLGVDLFFVLSGYLITSIIWTEIQAGSFTIGRFYERRIRRIMPALLLLLAVVTPICAWLLLPSDLVGYGKSLLASLTFVANIYFWRDTNYFSPLAVTKPLLHIWSLGVEEQFYILFPVLLALTARFWRRGAIPVVLMVTTGSFALDYLAHLYGAASPAFFLLPTRAWELGAGALLGLYGQRDGTLRRSTGNAIGVVGLLLIANGIAMALSTRLLSPNLSMVIGTCLIIVAGRNAATWVAKGLAKPIFVGPGLISYSLYLWHWPVVVIWRYYVARPPSAGEAMGLIAIMLVFSFGSWRYVEAPFRRKATRLSTVLAITGGTAAALGAAGFAIVITHGFPQRLSRLAAELNEAVGTNYRCSVQDMFPFGGSRACDMGLPSHNPATAEVVLLGNSHAQMYAPIWKQIVVGHRLKGMVVPLNACLPTATVNLDQGCAAAAKKNLDAVLALPSVRVVVIATTWLHGPDALHDASGRLLDNRGNRALQQGLDQLIDRIRGAGKAVVLIGPIPEPGWEVASILSRDVRFGRKPQRPLGQSARAFENRLRGIIDHFEQRDDIAFALPHRVLCDQQTCHYVLHGRAAYADSNHLAQAELWLFRTRFEQAFDQAW